MPKSKHNQLLRNNQVKLVLTGGHAATTALATVEEIIRRHGDKWRIYWIGAKSAFEGKKVPTIDSTVFANKGVKHHTIISGRLQKNFTPWTIPSIIKIPIGFVHAFAILLKIRPKVVLSFGGYVSFPVVVSAWLLRIPVVVHDQTASVGRASHFSSFFASKIALSRPESIKYFPKDKAVLTGNPVMSQIWDVPVKLDPEARPVIYITGGSRGARKINNLIIDNLDELLAKYKIIHQTGNLDYHKFKDIKREGYEAYPFIDPMLMSTIYRRADLIISRAGANTVSEIIAIKRPSILIPISWSSYDEQNENAKNAKKYGVVMILNEDNLSGKELLNALSALVNNYTKLVGHVINRASPDQDAQKKLVDLVEECID